MKTITIHEGTGDNAIEMTVQVTEEEFAKMEQIKQYSPSAWEGKELELIQEARKLLREELEEVKQDKEEVSLQKSEEVEHPISKENQPAKNSNGLWWTLGILGVLLLGYIIVHSIIQQKTNEAREVILNSGLSLITKPYSYQGLTLEYPGDWSFSENKLSDDFYMVGGRNNKGSEFGIFWVTNTEASASGFIDDIISGYANSGRFSNVEYSAIYDTRFNGKDAIAADYSYISNGEQFFAKVIGFVTNGNTVIINPIAHSKEALDGDDFKTLENSVRFTNTY